MRNMAFSLTAAAMRARTKTVTRRIGWFNLKPGDRLLAVEKSQGLRKEEKVVPIGEIVVTGTAVQAIEDVTQEDVIKEGFPGMSREEFIKMFCDANGCSRKYMVNRIEFYHAE